MLLHAIACRSMHTNPEKKSSKVAAATTTVALLLSTIVPKQTFASSCCSNVRLISRLSRFRDTIPLARARASRAAGGCSSQHEFRLRAKFSAVVEWSAQNAVDSLRARLITSIDTAHASGSVKPVVSCRYRGAGRCRNFERIPKLDLCATTD